MEAQISNRKWSAWIFLTIYYKQAVLPFLCKHKNARHFRRANFFAFFRDYYPQMPSPSGNKWGDVFEINSFFKKNFLFFLKNRLRFGAQIPNKWKDFLGK